MINFKETRYYICIKKRVYFLQKNIFLSKKKLYPQNISYFEQIRYPRCKFTSLQIHKLTKYDFPETSNQYERNILSTKQAFAQKVGGSTLRPQFLVPRRQNIFLLTLEKTPLEANVLDNSTLDNITFSQTINVQRRNRKISARDGDRHETQGPVLDPVAGPKISPELRNHFATSIYAAALPTIGSQRDRSEKGRTRRASERPFHGYGPCDRWHWSHRRSNHHALIPVLIRKSTCRRRARVVVASYTSYQESWSWLIVNQHDVFYGIEAGWLAGYSLVRSLSPRHLISAKDWPIGRSNDRRMPIDRISCPVNQSACGALRRLRDRERDYCENGI